MQRSLFVPRFFSFSLAHAAETTSMVDSWQRLHQELYSESTYYEKYNVVTETRVRSYLPLWMQESWSVEPYLGVSMQYQSPGAEYKYFDNTATPALGVQARFFQRITLQAQGGVRTNLSSEEENKNSEWDPRLVLSAGDFWSWNPRKPTVFSRKVMGKVLTSRACLQHP